MSSNNSLPPAGWYPAPDGSGGKRWWDGAQWGAAQPAAPVSTPVTSPAFAPAITQSPVEGLARATQTLLIVSGVASVATVIVELIGFWAITAFNAGDFSALDVYPVYESLSAVVTVASVLALVAAGVLWMIWQYRVAQRATGRTRRTPGWHAWSWVIPVVSLWFPYQNISDLWRAFGRARPSWLGLWWGLWIGGSVATSVSSRLAIVADSLGTLQGAMSFGILGEVASLAAVPFAWLIVKGLTEATRNAPGVSASGAYSPLVP